MSGETVNLIDDVAEKLEGLFREMWPYQDIQEPMKRGEQAAALSLVEDIAYERGEDGELRLRPEEERRKRAEAHMERQEEARLAAQRISRGVSEQLERLTPATYPRSDPETPRRMAELFERISRSYTTRPDRVRFAGQRSAGPILEYLYTSCDHAYWLWKEWIASFIALDDHEAASALIAVLTDPTASSTQAHHFNAEGGQFKPLVQVALAMIALRRDGDLELAHKYADAARLGFGESREAVACYGAISHLRREVEAGRLEIAGGATNGSARGSARIVDAAVPAAALLTGRWGGAQAPQLEHEE